MHVYITGIGAISAAGNDLKSSLETFQKGTRNAGPVSIFETELEKPVFESRLLPEDQTSRQMRTLDLCMHAVREALQDANLDGNILNNYRVGVCLGTTVASQLNDIAFYRAYKQNGHAPMDAVDTYMQGNLAGAVSRTCNLNGPALTVVNACSSGSDAIGIGLSWLKTDQCDIVIAGGADELNHVPLAGFNSLSILDDSLCAPFDRDRAGLNLGEGAGILVLESEKVMTARGNKPVLSVAGYGAASDAYHLTAPHPDGIGLESAIMQALQEADITKTDISFINAHGTGTHDNDKVEGTTLRRLFGNTVPFLSTKGFTGHTLGAAGGLEAVFSAASLQHGWIPGSPGFKNIDQEIGIAPVSEKTSLSQQYALSTSLAFGGNNAALVIKLHN